MVELLKIESGGELLSYLKGVYETAIGSESKNIISFAGYARLIFGDSVVYPDYENMFSFQSLALAAMAARWYRDRITTQIVTMLDDLGQPKDAYISKARSSFYKMRIIDPVRKLFTDFGLVSTDFLKFKLQQDRARQVQTSDASDIEDCLADSIFFSMKEYMREGNLDLAKPGLATVYPQLLRYLDGCNAINGQTLLLGFMPLTLKDTMPEILSKQLPALRHCHIFISSKKLEHTNQFFKEGVYAYANFEVLSL